MNIKQWMAGLCLAALAGPALAENFSKTILLSPDADGDFSAGFSATHREQGLFTDTYTILLSGAGAPGLYSFGQMLYGFQLNGQASTSGSVATNVIDLSALQIHSAQSFAFASGSGSNTAKNISTGALLNTQSIWLQPNQQGWTLTISGIAGTGLPAGSAIAATYNGTLNGAITTAVPEPQTAALMLAGLMCVGFVARRRRVI